MIKIQQQHGVVLVIALVFLSLMTMIGVTAMQSTTQEAKMANNAAQRGLAFQYAEAGLRAAETYLRSGIMTTESFNNTTIGLRGPVILPPNIDIVTYWMDNYEWKATNPHANGGSIRWCDDPDNFQLCVALNDDIKNEQRYVIERLTTVTTSGSGEILAGRPLPPTQQFLYRITARSTGNVTDAIIILQSTIK